jgi:hypothetical protein
MSRSMSGPSVGSVIVRFRDVVVIRLAARAQWQWPWVVQL